MTFRRTVWLADGTVTVGIAGGGGGGSPGGDDDDFLGRAWEGRGTTGAA